MERIIEVKVNGYQLTKDNRYAGVQGEANVTTLRITFDESWDAYAKTITFWDARGENPVEVILAASLLENIAESTRTYLVLIPAEPLVHAGSFDFVIDGALNNKRQRSVCTSLAVRPAPSTDDAGEPIDPTPTQAEQLQAQIEAMLPIMQADKNAAVAAAHTAENSADSAANSAGSAANSAMLAAASKDNAATSAQAALSSAQAAGNSAQDAQTARTEAALSAAEAEDAAARATAIASGDLPIAATKADIDAAIA